MLMCAYTPGVWPKVFFHEDEWHFVTGSRGCPPGNGFNLEINLVQSGAKKDFLTRFLDVNVLFSLNGSDVSFLETGLHFSLKSVKSLRNDNPNTHKGRAHRQRAYNIFDSEKLTIFSCAPDTDGVQTSCFWIWSPMLYQLSHPVSVTQLYIHVMYKYMYLLHTMRSTTCAASTSSNLSKNLDQCQFH